MKYYISDTHFRHYNILGFDNRPWNNVMDMEEDMIQRWNARVKKSDQVYILGDFCWGNTKEWKEILPKLHGQKFLIYGNHDLMSEEISRFFAQKPTHYKEVKDNGYLVCMSHFPMIAYNHDHRNETIMLYGHVHNTVEEKAVQDAVKASRERNNTFGYPYKGRLYNAWCGYYNWAPATLDEIIAHYGTSNVDEGG